MPPSRFIQLTLICLLGMLPTLAVRAQALNIYTEVAPPNQVKLPNGEMGGPTVDVVREIQRRIQNKDPIQLVPWARGYDQLTRVPNTLLFVVARTPERNALFHWVGPISETVFRLYVRADSKLVLNSLDDAKNLNAIGVYRNDARDQVLTNAGLTNLERTKDNVSNVKKLMLNRIDAFAASSLTIDELVAAADVPREQVRDALSFLTVQTWLAFSMGTPESSVAAWSDALAAMKKDKTFEQIMKAGNPKWVAPKTPITKF